MGNRLLSRRTRQNRLLGILGGLGPLAHIEFEQRLLHHSARRGAHCDQDHPDWLLVSASSTPDRSRCLAGQGPDCVPAMVKSGGLLESMGADFLVVTCNTAHAFYPQIQSQLTIPWLHMMDATAQHIAQSFPQVKSVGVLATDGTVRSQLYSKSLRSYDLVPISPELNDPIQQQVMEAIYSPDWGIKSGGIWISDIALQALQTAVVWLVEQGADLVIAGCTELSVGMAKLSDYPVNWIDPLDVMATHALDYMYQLEPTTFVPIRSAN